MPHALVALGSNLAPREVMLRRAIDALAADPQLTICSLSTLHATEPVGGPAGQGEFLNAALVLETLLAPEALLERLQQIEATLGRQRHQRWAARSIDLDLLLVEQQVVESERLVLPHPRLSFRRFVLEPACEIAAQWRHPLLGQTLGELLARLNDSPRYLALAGLELSRRQSLARLIAQRSGTLLIAAQALLGGDGRNESALLAALDAEATGRVPEVAIKWPGVATLATQTATQIAAAQAASRWCVSDFYLTDETIARLVATADPSKMAEPAEMAATQEMAVNPALAWLLRPRLVGLLAEPRLNRMAGQPLWNCGPTLWLHGLSDAECVEEVLAAIEAA